MTNLSQTLKAFREKFPLIGCDERDFEGAGMKEEVEEFIAESIKSVCEEMVVGKRITLEEAPDLITQPKETLNWYVDLGYEHARQDQLERLNRILEK